MLNSWWCTSFLDDPRELHDLHRVDAQGFAQLPD
jgi:hypothetical protein